MKKIILLTIFASFFSHAIYAKDKLPSKITGLKMPESCVQTKDGKIYITEIGEFGKNGDGQISVVDKKGNVKVFVTGLDDPKGIAARGDKLYVTDINRVIEINKDGTHQVYGAQMAFPGTPVFLNDIEFDQMGNLYVSDSGTLKSGGQIYKIAKGGGEITLVADSKNPDILAPNGLLNEGRNNLLEVDFESGVLYRVNLSTGATTPIADGFGGGDGIVKTKSGKVFVSDWKNGVVYQATGGKAHPIKSGYQAAADITLMQNGKVLMVPDMKAGELDFIEVN
jgi:gluconolactonase